MDAAGLKALPLFASLSDEALKALAAAVREVSVSEGTHIVDQGDFSYDFYAIEEGSADVLRDGERVAQFGPGDFFGETGLLQKGLRNATVVATSRVRLITLTAWDIRRLRGQIPELGERIRTAMEARTPDEG